MQKITPLHVIFFETLGVKGVNNFSPSFRHSFLIGSVDWNNPWLKVGVLVNVATVIEEGSGVHSATLVLR